MITGLTTEQMERFYTSLNSEFEISVRTYERTHKFDVVHSSFYWMTSGICEGAFAAGCTDEQYSDLCQMRWDLLDNFIKITDAIDKKRIHEEVYGEVTA